MYSSRKCVYLTRFRELLEAEFCRLSKLFLDDLVAEIDALVADIDPRAGDELLDLLLRLAAERAFQQFPAVSEFRHRRFFSLIEATKAHSAPRPLCPGGHIRRRDRHSQGVATEIRTR